MTKFDCIFSIAVDNHGLVSSAQAKQAGISNNEMVQYAKRGRIVKVGHGLYKLARWVPESNDVYAWAVLSVGADAWLYGESVIAMLGLVPANPDRIFVASSKRVRRQLPEGVTVERIEGEKPSSSYDGIPCQSVYDAILACREELFSERLKAATKAARDQGLISKTEYSFLKMDLEELDGDK